VVPNADFRPRVFASEGDTEGVGVWAVANETPMIRIRDVN
jgi:hypothetical protein